MRQSCIDTVQNSLPLMHDDSSTKYGNGQRYVGADRYLFAVATGLFHNGIFHQAVQRSTQTLNLKLFNSLYIARNSINI